MSNKKSTMTIKPILGFRLIPARSGTWLFPTGVGRGCHQWLHPSFSGPISTTCLSLASISDNSRSTSTPSISGMSSIRTPRTFAAMP